MQNSGRKVTRRREREKKNNAVNSGHFVSVTAHATTRTKNNKKGVWNFATWISFMYAENIPHTIIQTKHDRSIVESSIYSGTLVSISLLCYLQ